MPITQEQIDAIKKECEAVLELGGGEVFATLPAHDVLDLANSRAQLEKRVKELEKVLDEVIAQETATRGFTLGMRSVALQTLASSALSTLSNTKGDE